MTNGHNKPYAEMSEQERNEFALDFLKSGLKTSYDKNPTGSTNNFFAIWTEYGYDKQLYCYYCKAIASWTNKVEPSGWGCSNCKNYADIKRASNVN